MRLVENWRTGWRWFSSWAFVLIVFLATNPLPDEILVLLPAVVQDHLTAVVAVCGLVLRFVRQSEGLRDG